MSFLSPTFARRGKGYRLGPAPQVISPPLFQAAHAALVFKDAPIAASMNLRSWTKIQDQGGQGECVIFSFGQSLYICQGVQGVPDPINIAKNETYYAALKIDGMNDPVQDVGTHLEAAAQALNLQGFASDVIFPYKDDGVTFQTAPSDAYLRLAFDQSIAAHSQGKQKGESCWHPITGSDQDKLDALCLGLSNKFPGQFGADVSNPFAENRIDPKTPLDPPTTDIDGQHCQTIIGFYRLANGALVFLIANSWSEGWGDRGCWLASQEYILSASALGIMSHVYVEGAP